MTETLGLVNGIDPRAVAAVRNALEEDPRATTMSFQVETEWQGRTTMSSTTGPLDFRGEKVERQHTIVMDEPQHLQGSDLHLNPQEALFAAINSCLMVTFTIGAAVHGVRLETLRITSQGTLDLRGAFGLDPSIPVGYNSLHLDVHVKGEGTREQFQQILDEAYAITPNVHNLTRSVRLETALTVGQ